MTKDEIFKIFSNLLRPAGGGIPTFSAGKGSAIGLQSTLYRIVSPVLSKSKSKKDLTVEEIDRCWKESWDGLPKAKVVLVGVPLDTGAGIRRGAAYGPRGVREELYKLKTFQKMLVSREVVDLGDIFVNPHLLHDEMLNSDQIKLCQEAMYATAEPELRSRLPVAALSQLKFLLHTLAVAYPHLRFQVIGGDHSIGWPVSEVVAAKYPGTLGIIQPDAHTDLLASRLGVKYCFGTWSYHANDLIFRGGKMVQIGIRQSGKDKAHWEQEMGVKQYWAEEILSRDPDEVVQEIVDHFKERGVRQIYFSNDIDGTDDSEASATGTPAPLGMEPSFVVKVIKALGDHFEVVAGDVNEVAPDLAANPAARKRTCRLAAKYMQTCLEAQLSNT